MALLLPRLVVRHCSLCVQRWVSHLSAFARLSQSLPHCRQWFFLLRSLCAVTLLCFYPSSFSSLPLVFLLLRVSMIFPTRCAAVQWFAALAELVRRSPRGGCTSTPSRGREMGPPPPSTACVLRAYMLVLTPLRARARCGVLSSIGYWYVAMCAASATLRSLASAVAACTPSRGRECGLAPLCCTRAASCGTRACSPAPLVLGRNGGGGL